MGGLFKRLFGGSGDEKNGDRRAKLGEGFDLKARFCEIVGLEVNIIVTTALSKAAFDAHVGHIKSNAVVKNGGGHSELTDMTLEAENSLYNIVVGFHDLVASEQILSYEEAIKKRGGRALKLLDDAKDDADIRRIFYLGVLKPSLRDLCNYSAHIQKVCSDKAIKRSKRLRVTSSKQMEKRAVQAPTKAECASGTKEVPPAQGVDQAKHILRGDISKYEKRLTEIVTLRNELDRKRSEQLDDLSNSAASLKALRKDAYGLEYRSLQDKLEDAKFVPTKDFLNAVQALYTGHHSSDYLHGVAEPDDELMGLAERAAQMANEIDDVLHSISVLQSNLESGYRLNELMAKQEDYIYTALG